MALRSELVASAKLDDPRVLFAHFVEEPGKQEFSFMNGKVEMTLSTPEQPQIGLVIALHDADPAESSVTRTLKQIDTPGEQGGDLYVDALMQSSDVGLVCQLRAESEGDIITFSGGTIRVHAKWTKNFGESFLRAIAHAPEGEKDAIESFTSLYLGPQDSSRRESEPNNGGRAKVPEVIPDQNETKPTAKGKVPLGDVENPKGKPKAKTEPKHEEETSGVMRFSADDLKRTLGEIANQSADTNEFADKVAENLGFDDICTRAFKFSLDKAIELGSFKSGVVNPKLGERFDQKSITHFKKKISAIIDDARPFRLLLSTCEEVTANLRKIKGEPEVKPEAKPEGEAKKTITIPYIERDIEVPTSATREEILREIFKTIGLTEEPDVSSIIASIERKEELGDERMTLSRALRNYCLSHQLALEILPKATAFAMSLYDI